MRPVPTRWFELLTPRDDLGPAMEALASTAAVELQAHGTEGTGRLSLSGLQSPLEAYAELEQRYHAYWPEPRARDPFPPRFPAETMDHGLRGLEAWAAAADEPIARLQSLAHERGELELLQVLLAAAPERLPDLRLLARAGPLLRAALFLLPARSRPPRLPPGVLAHRIEAGGRLFLLALGTERDMAAAGQEMTALKARSLELPRWLPPGGRAAAEAVARRLHALDGESVELDAELERLSVEHDLAHILGEIVWLAWFAAHAQALPVTGHFGWVTGWTSDPPRVAGALEDAGVRCLLRLADRPAGYQAPLVLSNPRWARTFEVFARLLGTPAAHEADPTPLVALLVPVMFGYMFGDVGQGAVLLLGGLVLQRRWPALRLLIPGGIMSMAFGFLFGSVFSREELIPALWVHPLEAPVEVLGVALASGVAILVTGLCLDACQHHWRGAARTWWSSQAGLVLAYVAILASMFHSSALWAAGAGAAWYVLGHAVEAGGRRLAGLTGAVAELVESLLRLAVNTLSFARVGAFALAHAGLSGAVVGLAEAAGPGPGGWVVMGVGNVVIIVLEGLVVGVQTTRLVLFEFFVRFLRAEGRGFRPLPEPRLPVFATRATAP